MALDRNRSRETGRVNFRTDFWGQGNYCSIADGCSPVTISNCGTHFGCFSFLKEGIETDGKRRTGITF